VSSARVEASRENGATSRGPKTAAGKRAAQNALKHGLRAEKHLVLPDENAAEFAALEASLIEELAPVGALPTVLARRVAVAGWGLARADRLAAETGLGPVPPRGGQQAELFQERGYGNASPGLHLIRDGNGTHSFETRWREPAPTLVVDALRPTAIAAPRWPSSGARAAPSRRSRPSRRSKPMPLAHPIRPASPGKAP
jgi:hypothetical protein